MVNAPDDKTRPLAPSNGFHVCFTAPDPEAVRRFYAVGLAHGGIDNGAPGYRQQYAPNYYGAFLIDPDGHHLGVVCRTGARVGSEARARECLNQRHGSDRTADHAEHRSTPDLMPGR